MTDAERKQLSERLAIAAEQAGLSSKLIWNWAEECPQCGQPTDMDITTGTCGACFCHSALPKVYYDLTNPVYLLPLAEAWRQRRSNERTWIMRSANRYHSFALALVWNDPKSELAIEYHHADAVVALAQALSVALEGEERAMHHG